MNSNLKKTFGILCVATLAIGAFAQQSTYQSRTLFSGSITNDQTLTGSVSGQAVMDTNKIELALSPAGGVCPVDIQVYLLATNASTSNVVVNFKRSMDGVRWTTASISLTNALTGTTAVDAIGTIASTNLGNARYLKLESVVNRHASTIRAKVDYGFWKPK